MTPAAASLRIVIVAPDSLAADPADPPAEALAERSRSLRIGMLQSGCNIDDHVGADLGQPLWQEHVGRQRGHARPGRLSAFP